MFKLLHGILGTKIRNIISVSIVNSISLRVLFVLSRTIPVVTVVIIQAVFA